MNKHFEFAGLFVFDLANNHQGDVDHALRIIEETGQVVARHGVRAALKFQFRQLDSFIHPSHREGSANKHIPRFLSTRLSWRDFDRLADAVRQAGMITMATPFDENSVDRIEAMDLDVIKIASCSATDWPLVEKIALHNKPVIFSTAGLGWKEIEDLISFFDHRLVHCAIMHCVALYPTPNDQLNLDQIRLLRERYRDKTVGFSTHECPDDLSPVQIAVAKGAQLLERHVGIPTEKAPLNAYSSTPEQIDRWIQAALRARVLCGPAERPTPSDREVSSLRELKRGVYAKQALKAGAPTERADVYFAMPCEPGQLTAGEWKDGIVPAGMVDRDQPLLRGDIKVPESPDKQVLFTAIHSAKAMLNEARIALPTDFETEFSHHYGIARFPEVGVIMITCINRSYCKKLIVQLPGQRHPMHYHKKKEETFQVLHGVLEMRIEGRPRTLYPGDILLIQQGTWHEFWTETGVIFEEISTTHFPNDSFYEDKHINAAGSARKTLVNQWGRYQI